MPAGYVGLLDFTTTNQVDLVVLPSLLLNITNVANNVVLSWTNATYHLQATPTLAPAAWVNISGASPVTLPITGSSRYFRLIAP